MSLCAQRVKQQSVMQTECMIPSKEAHLSQLGTIKSYGKHCNMGSVVTKVAIDVRPWSISSASHISIIYYVILVAIRYQIAINPKIGLREPP